MSNPESVPTTTPSRIPVSMRQIPSAAEMMRPGHETTVLSYTHRDPSDQYSDLLINEETPFTREDSGIIRQQTMPPEQTYDDSAEGRWITPEEQESIRARIEAEAEQAALAEFEREQAGLSGSYQYPAAEEADDGRFLSVKYRGPDARVELEVEEFGNGSRINGLLDAIRGVPPQDERYYATADRAEEVAYGGGYGYNDPATSYAPAPRQLRAAAVDVEPEADVEHEPEEGRRMSPMEFARKHKRITHFLIFGLCVAAYRPTFNVVVEAGKQGINGEVINFVEIWKAATGQEVPRGEDW